MRRERRARALAAVLVGALGAAAFVVIRRFPADLPRFRVPTLALSVSRAARLDHASVRGAPAALEPALLRSVGSPESGAWGWGEASRAALRLKASFPCLKEARVERDWFRRELRFRVELRRPVALAARSGRPGGWLGEDGSLFSAPEGVYSEEGLPVVEFGRSGEQRHVPLAELLEAAGREGALPARLVRAEYRSPEHGWELLLSDGTRVLWGNLSWTGPKLARLRQVWSDAGARFAGGFLADFRYFEDGRILVRPAVAAAATPARWRGRAAGPPGYAGI